MIKNKEINEKTCSIKSIKYFSEKYLNPLSQLLVWHIKKLTCFTTLLVVLMHIQAINPLIFWAQRLMSFLEFYTLL